MPSWKRVVVSGSNAALNTLTVTNGITGSLFGTASWALNTATASYVNPLIQNVVITGSLLVSGSTTQIGNNNLQGTTTLSGSINISGNTTLTGSLTALNQTASFGYVSASFLDITGKQVVRGYTQYLPTLDVVPIDQVGGYVYSSGSQGDLYFAQTNGSINNVTRLRWIEGNMYSGLLNGAVISTASSTAYNVSSGSGIIVTLNGSLSSDPYPAIQYISWGNLSSSIAPLSASYDQSFIAIEPTGSTGKIYVQGTPYNDGQFNTLIPIGNVIHQNRSTINATATYPSVAYGYKQRTNDFIRAFGPLKLSGLNTYVSGSSTGSIIVASGTAYSDGRNYTTDPNNPSYITDPGTTTSKIFRYYQSGSGWIYDTNGGAGYGAIDPTRYSLDGVLTPVPGTGSNRRWSIQRVYFFPAGATKGIYVYYGNETYATQVEATANIPFEDFVEAPNTAAGAVLSAYLVVRNNANFTDTTSYNIQQGGLFRNVGGSGGGGSAVTQTLTGLSDVSIIGPTNGQPLAYNQVEGKWENLSSITADLIGTASWAVSASWAPTVSTFPYTGSALITGSLGITGSFSTTRDILVNEITVGRGGGNLSGSTVLGFNAAGKNITGVDNTVIGYNAMSSSTLSSNNTVIGKQAMELSTSPYGSVAIGLNAMRNGSMGGNDVAIGNEALMNYSNATNNVAIGGGALRDMTNNNNTAVGIDAGRYASSGGNNTGGSNSVYVGRNARPSSNNEINQIVIGENAIGLGTNSTTIGNSSTTVAVIYGNLALGKTTAGAKLDVNGNTVITGSLTVTQGITGSLFGTASFASTASFAPAYLPITLPQTTGLEISFTQDRVYGTFALPETGSAIISNTGSAILGVTNLIIHSASAAPTTGSDFKKLSGSPNYVPGLNYIYCTYIADNQIIYSINQAT
jgi:hypothetical protein